MEDGRGRTLTRREVVRTLALGCAGVGLGARPAPARAASVLTRTIPSSGTPVTAVGMGTWQTFDVGGGEAERAPLREVLRRFVELEGQVVDSSPMYGRSEAVLGDLAGELGVGGDLFHATKVWTRGRADGVAQMERSFTRMRVDVMDLMQVHNLLDWRTHLDTLARWKEEGRVRHVGVTHYRVGAYDDLEAVLRERRPDVVQLNHSVAVRDAADRLLPLAADLGVAVLVNRPYEGGDLFRAVRGREVPAWARDFAPTWGRFFLTWILADPAVTCVIPATSDPGHLADNMAAAGGRLPDAGERARMAELVDAL